ncbi:MAG: hypothetical protein JWN05_3058 [Arthrobacter sp.]|nr:hypothetical protein [Arthrobacter sp.]
MRGACAARAPPLLARAEPATVAAPPGNPRPSGARWALQVCSLQVRSLQVRSLQVCSLQVCDGLAPSQQIENGEQNDQDKDASDHEGRNVVVHLLPCFRTTRTTQGRRRRLNRRRCSRRGRSHSVRASDGEGCCLGAAPAWATATSTTGAPKRAKAPAGAAITSRLSLFPHPAS